MYDIVLAMKPVMTILITACKITFRETAGMITGERRKGVRTTKIVPCHALWFNNHKYLTTLQTHQGSV
jgi:hypothetical protein